MSYGSWLEPPDPPDPPPMELDERGNCWCDAYPFPHRPTGGDCTYVEPTDYCWYDTLEEKRGLR